MAVEIETVLVPVDGTSEAERAVEYAVAVAQRYDAGVHVLHVVGESVEDLVAAVEASGGRTRVGEPARVVAADPDVIVAVGESRTFAVARERPSCPLLPVDAGRGLRSVPADGAVAAVDALLSDGWTTERHPLVRVEYDGETVARALTDVTLVTAEAARISEFSVTARGDHVGQFRADGVVVATPAGTAGYAHRVGTPIAAAGTGIVTVAPIAPFATNPDHWIVGDDRVRLTVERDEAEVRLFADDRGIGAVAVDEPVTLTTDRSITLAVLDQSRPRFPRS